VVYLSTQMALPGGSAEMAPLDTRCPARNNAIGNLHRTCPTAMRLAPPPRGGKTKLGGPSSPLDPGRFRSSRRPLRAIHRAMPSAAVKSGREARPNPPHARHEKTSTRPRAIPIAELHRSQPLGTTCFKAGHPVYFDSIDLRDAIAWARLAALILAARCSFTRTHRL